MAKQPKRCTIAKNFICSFWRSCLLLAHSERLEDWNTAQELRCQPAIKVQQLA